MAAAVHHLHDRHKVAHLDIKLQNMLLDQSHERLKMCDFGTAQIKGDSNGRWCGELLPHPNPGTEEFAAPEIIERRDIDGFKADLWSLGVCLFTLVTGYQPFGIGAHAEPQRESAAAGSVGSFAGSAGSSAGCSTTTTDSSDSAAASHAVTEVVAPRLRADSTKYDVAYTQLVRNYEPANQDGDGVCELLIVDIYDDEETYNKLYEETGLLPFLNSLMEPDPNDRQAPNLAAVSHTGPWPTPPQAPIAAEYCAPPSYRDLCAGDEYEGDEGKPRRTRKLSMRDALPQGVRKSPLKSSPVRLFD